MARRTFVIDLSQAAKCLDWQTSSCSPKHQQFGRHYQAPNRCLLAVMAPQAEPMITLECCSLQLAVTAAIAYGCHAAQQGTVLFGRHTSSASTINGGRTPRSVAVSHLSRLSPAQGPLHGTVRPDHACSMRSILATSPLERPRSPSPSALTMAARICGCPVPHAPLCPARTTHSTCRAHLPHTMCVACLPDMLISDVHLPYRSLPLLVSRQMHVAGDSMLA